jgi:hypothetical protein
MPKTKWKSYEELAQFILRELSKEFGLAVVEGTQVIPGESGTEWEIDAKGVRIGDSGIILIECRRYIKSKLKQEQMAAIAYRIKDIGAAGGITVSPLDPQKGAKILAAHENITHVVLDPDSTTENYFVKFLNKAFLKLTEKLSISDSFHGEILSDGKKAE